MKWHEKRFRSVISPPYRRRYYDGLSMLAVAWRGAVSRVRRKLRSDWEKWAWNNEDTLAVALHFVFCPHARHSTTKVTTSRCCGKITRRESICWQLAPREELSLLSCQIHSHQLRGYCQHSLLRKLCAKLHCKCLQGFTGKVHFVLVNMIGKHCTEGNHNKITGKIFNCYG